MNAALIGLSSSLISILIISFFKRADKNTVYGLILMGIGFLYIGYTWTDIPTFVMSIAQALVFMTIAYLGIKKNSWYLIAGYFLHGIWDMVYPFLADPALLPPDYDYFCLTYDFVVGFYLLYLHNRQPAKPVYV